MWNAIKIEIKNSILKSWFHIVRFIGLLFIPFLYGFFYIFAFFQPFENVKNIDVIVVSQKNDKLGDALGTELEKEQNISIGDIEMTMKMEHIYSDNKNKNELVNNAYATLELPNMKVIENILVDEIKKQNLQTINDLVKLFQGHEQINLILNNKKNYLLAFGIENALDMYSTLKATVESLVKSVANPKYQEHLIKEKGVSTNELNTWLINIQKSNIMKVDPITIKSHMGKHAKYGFGLAPFFVSVAMWVGALVLTFAINRKIFDSTINSFKIYISKWLLLMGGLLLQATILMISLATIGFGELGVDHWFGIYLGAIISGLIFGSIVQAIRFSIHNKAIGILLSIILLVLQMTSAGGLFPIETQLGFYKVLNAFMPMGYTVKIIREFSFETNAINILIYIVQLLPWLLSIALGMFIFKNRNFLNKKQVQKNKEPK